MRSSSARGMSGGWAAKELTEKGLKTLVLERGRMVRHRRIPHGHQRSLGSAVRQPHHAGNAPAQARADRAPVIPRRRTSTGSSTISTIPTSRRSPSTGCAAITSAAARSCGRARAIASARMDFEAQRQRRRGRSLARELRRDRALVRQGGDLRRHQRQRRRPAATARRQIPSAVRSQLRRSRFQEAPRRQAGPQAHHRPRAPISPRRSRTTRARSAAPASRATCASAAVLTAATSAASRPRCRRPNAPAT